MKLKNNMQNSFFFVHLIVTLPICRVIHLLIRSGAGFSNVYLVAKATRCRPLI